MTLTRHPPQLEIGEAVDEEVLGVLHEVVGPMIREALQPKEDEINRIKDELKTYKDALTARTEELEKTRESERAAKEVSVFPCAH